jgi:hypothetical protein
MATPSMPTRGHTTAPKFSPDQPRELRRYFEELEVLFGSCSITAEPEMKKHACRYLDIDTSDFWQSIPEYGPATNYANWKVAIYKLYPGSDDQRRWTMTDMDKLVGERTRLGIQSVDELASYYRSFHTITSHLIAQSRISTSEQSRAFVRGFQPSLWSKVKQRLEIKFPDFDQDSAYTLEQVYNAATYILHGTHPSLLPQHPITQIKSPEPPASHGKLEDLEVLIGQIAQAMQTLVAVQMQNTSANMSATSTTIIPPIHNHQNHNHPAGTTCNFCGKVEHFLGSCPMVVIYIAAGKCSRNQDGKLVLPSGAFVPRIIVGRNLAE